MNYKHYSCEEYECYAPDNCCLFCKHCTDVFWDYANGPYMFICNIDCRGEWDSCGQFEAEE